MRTKGPCKRSQHCWPTRRNIFGPNMLRAFSYTPCCALLRVVATCWKLFRGWSLKLVKLHSQQVPTFLLFRSHWCVIQQCCVRLHSTSNNVAPPHAHQRVVCMELWVFCVPGSFVFSFKDPTCCDLLRAFAHIS